LGLVLIVPACTKDQSEPRTRNDCSRIEINVGPGTDCLCMHKESVGTMHKKRSNELGVKKLKF